MLPNNARIRFAQHEAERRFDNYEPSSANYLVYGLIYRVVGAVLIVISIATSVVLMTLSKS